MVWLLMLPDGAGVERSVVQVGGKIWWGKKPRDKSIDGVRFYLFLF